MDQDEKQPPPRPEEVEALAAQSLPEGAPPGETRPTWPAAEPPAAQAAPPAPRAAAGQTMPPPPAPDTAPDPGLQRTVEDSNLDAVAQAEGSGTSDRYSADALQDVVEGGMISVPVQQINRALIEIW